MKRPWNPPTIWTSIKVCPRCGSRATKLFYLGMQQPYQCQECEHTYAAPDPRQPKNPLARV